MFDKKISLSKLQKKDPAELAKFAYIVDPVEFSYVFNKIGIAITSYKDVNTLIEYHRDGKDKNGAIKKADGITSINFDLVEVISQIDISQKELEAANINFID